MKRFLSLLLALALLPASGCMTARTIEAARQSPHTYEVKDAKTGEVTTRTAYPAFNYLLVPITVPADLAFSPLGFLALLIWMGGAKC